jgi:hypothetical protein
MDDVGVPASDMFCSSILRHKPRTVCFMCKTGYVSRINRMRCESAAVGTNPAPVDKPHRHRPNDPTALYCQPCLIPCPRMCTLQHQIKCWWESLPAKDACGLLWGVKSDNLGAQICSRWLIPENLAASDLNEVEMISQHPIVREMAYRAHVVSHESFLVAGTFTPPSAVHTCETASCKLN